jgi:hypothetical protein
MLATLSNLLHPEADASPKTPLTPNPASTPLAALDATQATPGTGPATTPNLSAAPLSPAVTTNLGSNQTPSDLASALEAVVNDLEQDAQPGASANLGQLSTDLGTLDGVLQQETSSITSQLIASGESPTEASESASAATTITIDVSTYATNGTDTSATNLSLTTSVASAAEATNGPTGTSTLGVASSVSNSLSFTSLEQTPAQSLLQSTQETSNATALDVLSFANPTPSAAAATQANPIAAQTQALLASTNNDIRAFNKLLDSIVPNSQSTS